MIPGVQTNSEGDLINTNQEFAPLIERMRMLVAHICEALPVTFRKYIDELHAGGFSSEQIAALTCEAARQNSVPETAVNNLAVAVRAYLAHVRR
jgi:hypothetical protein